MPISGAERRGIEDLLLEERNVPTLVQLAKSVTKNVCEIESTSEALNFVCTHIGDAAALLNKRLITKEILFKYLHRRQVVIKADFTKATLVNKVVELWARDGILQNDDTVLPTSIDSTYTTDSRLEAPTTTAHDCVSHVDNINTTESRLQTTTTTSQDYGYHYPIHLLAREFTSWFFAQYNNSILIPADFYSDARLNLRIAANDCTNDRETAGALAVIDALMQSKHQFDFHFNPNMTHDGVQGRIDAYGLVLVLACGTLHTQQTCVGVFECTFGLLRDPYAQNNWKVKTIQCLLRSQPTLQAPSLYSSETLRECLALPVPMEELT